MKAKPATRNRILRHVRVRAGNLVPHELNPRRHSEAAQQGGDAAVAPLGKVLETAANGLGITAGDSGSRHLGSGD